MTLISFENCKIVHLPCNLTYFYEKPEGLEEWLDGDCLEDNCIEHEFNSKGFYTATIELNTFAPCYPDYEGDFDFEIRDVVKIYE